MALTAMFGGCTPICGDNIVVSGEACDDGNLEINDGCSDICQVETGFNCDVEGCNPICGDSIVVSGNPVMTATPSLKPVPTAKPSAKFAPLTVPYKPVKPHIVVIT